MSIPARAPSATNRQFRRRPPHGHGHSSGTTNYYVDLTIYQPLLPQVPPTIRRRQGLERARVVRRSREGEDQQVLRDCQGLWGERKSFVVSTDGLLSPTALSFLQRLDTAFNRDKSRLVRHPLDLATHVQDAISTIIFNYTVAFSSFLYRRF